jgi:hypothetical protein
MLKNKRFWRRMRIPQPAIRFANDISTLIRDHA